MRWGLRAGDLAWPDRSAPAPAVSKLSFNEVRLSLPCIRSLGVTVLPRLRGFSSPDGILQGLLSGTKVLEMSGSRTGFPDSAIGSDVTALWVRKDRGRAVKIADKGHLPAHRG